MSRKPTRSRTSVEHLKTGKPHVAIVGAGSLATFLSGALRESGYIISEIISRDMPNSRRRAHGLAAKVGARATVVQKATFDADLVWFCVPDREIRTAAVSLAKRGVSEIKFAFHSSGALLSRELDPLRKAGVAVASVHPLMTFVPGAHTSLAGVPFAIEGDAAAERAAWKIVRDLGGESFSLLKSRKAAYHAWATMTSPLLLAFLVTLEEAARAAGLTREDARRMSLPIIRQTLRNYERLGSPRSFSGPLVRGDSETVAKHLEGLKKNSGAREVYVVLAHAALRGLPVKNRKKIKQSLES
jgi:predicted short-subunit dehydrogenase-like oxidoreductase (DUF2520 family)